MASGDDPDDGPAYEPPGSAAAGDAGTVPPLGVHGMVDSGWLGHRPEPARGRPRLTTIIMVAVWIGTLALYLWLQRGG
ncbi:hypothetical protein [Nocardia sp. NPDC050406]|uniref:hypothetical protein n=1 Tax=Nocardia sp. NPDC050406 TaxID=3364318 RepID=UPI00379F9B75